MLPKLETYLVHFTPAGLFLNEKVELISFVKIGKIPPIITSPGPNKLGMSNLPRTSQPLTALWQKANNAIAMAVQSSSMFAGHF